MSWLNSSPGWFILYHHFVEDRWSN